MAISGLLAIALSQLRHLLSPAQFFTAIDLWFFLFGIGLIIIMNMIGHILRLHHRRQLFYWPAQMLLTLVIFISMIFIILVVSPAFLGIFGYLYLVSYYIGLVV